MLNHRLLHRHRDVIQSLTLTLIPILGIDKWKTIMQANKMSMQINKLLFQHTTITQEINRTHNLHKDPFRTKFNIW